MKKLFLFILTIGIGLTSMSQNKKIIGLSLSSGKKKNWLKIIIILVSLQQQCE